MVGFSVSFYYVIKKRKDSLGVVNNRVYKIFIVNIGNNVIEKRKRINLFLNSNKGG